MKHKSIILIFGFLIIHSVYGNTTPRRLSTDKRMQVVTYQAQQVVTIRAQHLVAISIQFADNERIQGVYIGDQVAWTYAINQIKPFILFIKPTLEKSKTNMTVITDKHIYHFQLLASKSIDNDPRAAMFNIKFSYPKQQQRATAKILKRMATPRPSPTILPPEKWQWNYSFVGSKQLAPIRAFDDGKFTYLQFDAKTLLPAVFRVDSNGKEALINTHMRGKYLVIEQVASHWVLRYDKLALCLLKTQEQKA